MSAEKQVLITCDECGRDEACAGTNIRGARRDARKAGWRTGLKSSASKASLYDIKRDVCPHCSDSA